MNIDNGLPTFSGSQLREVTEFALFFGLQMGNRVIRFRGVSLGIVKMGIPKRSALTIIDGVFLNEILALAL